MRCAAAECPHAFTLAEQDALLRHAERRAPLLTTIRGARQLVHSDFNPKNLLTIRRDGKWVLTAILDWAFALADFLTRPPVFGRAVTLVRQQLQPSSSSRPPSARRARY
jgi:Ser/Thr protein kinase RdoA (MazF antagonist)